MQQLYLEVRNLPTSPPATLAADIARHLQSRQYLGTAVVVCENPYAILSATRKQWLKGARHIQKLRASTLNAEEILRLTHAIMHMQNILFIARIPDDAPEAAIYFLTPDQLIPANIPGGCYSLYLTAPVPDDVLQKAIKRLQVDALVIDYSDHPRPSESGLTAKQGLEDNVQAEWSQLVHFLQSRGIEPDMLVVGNSLQFDAMDQALDTLLGASDEFLRHATAFQHAINLAQPLTSIKAEQQKTFEAVTRLAHRVQALTPGAFNNYLNGSFGDKATEAYFLRDALSELYEDLAAAAAKASMPPDTTGGGAAKSPSPI